MTRLILLAAILAGAVLNAQTVRAEGTARWCAVYSVSGGNVREDCNYNSIDECRRVIVAGDRGSCNMNPRYTGDPGRKSRTRN